MARESGVYVLDTSALLAFIEDEAGAERVERILLGEETFIPFTALLEVHYISFQEQGEVVAEHRLALLKQLPASLLWTMDEPCLFTASRFKATFHVSLADAMIAAQAKQLGATLVHKDPEYESLSQEIFLETLPYKHGSDHAAGHGDEDA